MALNKNLRPNARPANTIVRQRQARELGSDIVQFPNDLGPNKMVMTFKPYKYRTPAPVQTNGVFVDYTTARVETLATNTIVLPLPTNLQDQNEARLSRFDGNYIGDKIARSASQIVNGNNGNFRDVMIKSIKDNFGTGAGKNAAGYQHNGNWEKLIEDAGYVSKFSGQTVQKGISAGAGVVANPKAALSYDGHELKNHSFVWTFAPRSEEESTQLKNIINYIKYCQLPMAGGNIEAGMHLKYPMMVDIQFYGLDEEYFYNFKTCMIRSFNVNFAGQNQVAILKGGRPAIINMEMNLMEMDIHYASEMEGKFGGVLRSDEGRLGDVQLTGRVIVDEEGNVGTQIDTPISGPQ